MKKMFLLILAASAQLTLGAQRISPTNSLERALGSISPKTSIPLQDALRNMRATISEAIPAALQEITNAKPTSNDRSLIAQILKSNKKVIDALFTTDESKNKAGILNYLENTSLRTDRTTGSTTKINTLITNLTAIIPQAFKSTRKQIRDILLASKQSKFINDDECENLSELFKSDDTLLQA
jgi:hypothetical protein